MEKKSNVQGPLEILGRPLAAQSSFFLTEKDLIFLSKWQQCLSYWNHKSSRVTDFYILTEPRNATVLWTPQNCFQKWHADIPKRTLKYQVIQVSLFIVHLNRRGVWICIPFRYKSCFILKILLIKPFDTIPNVKTFI